MSFLDDMLERPEEAFKAVHTSKNKRPQLGFRYFHQSGKVSGFYYADISHPCYDVEDGREVVSFNHHRAGGCDMVTIEGRNLVDVQRDLIRCTVTEMHEHHNMTAKENVLVTMLTVKPV